MKIRTFFWIVVLLAVGGMAMGQTGDDNPWRRNFATPSIGFAALPIQLQGSLQLPV